MGKMNRGRLLVITFSAIMIIMAAGWVAHAGLVGATADSSGTSANVITPLVSGYNAVPEPATLAFIGVGSLLVAAMRRRTVHG